MIQISPTCQTKLTVSFPFFQLLPNKLVAFGNFDPVKTEPDGQQATTS